MRFVSFCKRWPVVVAGAAVCLIAAGIVGAITLFKEDEPITAASSQEQVELITPPAQAAPKSEIPATEESSFEEASITTPAELLPSVVSPLDGTTVTVFSMNELLYDETMADWRTHNGIDIQAGEGDVVKTAASGTVSSVRRDDLMGSTVTIEHDGGYATTYASLQEKPPVNEGQTVDAGDIIGYVGTTAAAELTMGPHLHFSVSRNGEIIDPEEYIR